ncbi:cell division protein FtsK [Clostridium sporogenes]|uniref:Cell division protein FtsK n=1 Tax=Clostridium sporogenes TaxID=1509 RepID=A0ABD6S5R8_CLOSG|nr:DNA translocase FtsK [Clostridium sporogenes]OSB19423.1 cell division protein FtsK [Clostridium sporogenes]
MVKKRTKSSKTEKKNNDITGIILISIGIFVLFSVFSPSASGIVGSFIKKVLIAVLGLGSLVFPILIIFTGCCFIGKKNKINLNSKFYGIVLFSINTLLFLQMILLKNYGTEDIMLGISKFYREDTMIHGGIISYLIDVPLYKLFGTIGCYILFICVYMISFILIFQISLGTILETLQVKRSIKNKKVKEKSIEDKEDIGGIEKELASDLEKDEGLTRNIKDKIKILDFMKNSEIKEEPLNIVDNSFNKNTGKAKEDTGEEAIKEELSKNINERGNNIKIEYNYPTLELLKQNVQSKLNKEDKKELINNANKLEETLSSFGVEAKVMQVSRGPSVTRFELQPNAGVKVSKIVNLADDIALNLAASGVRIEAPIPGKSAVGIEVPNKSLTPVYLREVIEGDDFQKFDDGLAFALGKDISGSCVVSDLSKTPHLLIAGATGSGKSVCINTLIISILYKYSPENVKLLMVDPKVVELSIYNGIPHLLIPVVTDPKKAAGALHWAVNEMTKRYSLFAENSVRNIEGYNNLYEQGKIENKLPYVVIIIDELADLMMVCPNDIEDYISRLAQMARAAGMHLVIATQRPSVDVITGIIKANIPSRISFAVSSSIDSRTILDMSGAEKLLGKGDMLFYPTGSPKPTRIQGAFISESEVEKVVSCIKDEQGEAEYREEIIDQIDTAVNVESGDEDELLEEAIRICIQLGEVSTSLIQRKLRIGYNRAARIIEQLEAKGIISGRDGNKPRQVIIDQNNETYGKYFHGNM